MPNLKFDSKVAAVAGDALEPYIRPLFDQPGMSIMCIAELRHVERTEPAPGTETSSSVKVRIVGMEIPNKDQEGYIREAQRALFLQRTAHGSLDEDTGEMELSEQTLRMTGGQMTYIETCRLTAVLKHWSDYARRVTLATLVDSEIRHEMQTISEGLRAALTASPLDEA